MLQRFLRELREKHDVDEAVFLVDRAHHLATALQRAGLRFRLERHGNRNTVERILGKIKQLTPLFSNSFSHVDPATAETWLQAFAIWRNSLN
ncbi:transposase [Natrialba aegyptia DSM 13077]|uniref:Transposase n=1 Tax=Natrialba aegyptia DSM 13077 TaxID=1227491 RepID=M0AHG0_9EURY|nr:transposase [Natrialba aegyptia DSM 13077]